MSTTSTSLRLINCCQSSVASRILSSAAKAAARSRSTSQIATTSQRSSRCQPGKWAESAHPPAPRPATRNLLAMSDISQVDAGGSSKPFDLHDYQQDGASHARDDADRGAAAYALAQQCRGKEGRQHRRQGGQ